MALTNPFALNPDRDREKLKAIRKSLFRSIALGLVITIPLIFVDVYERGSLSALPISIVVWLILGVMLGVGIDIVFFFTKGRRLWE